MAAPPRPSPETPTTAAKKAKTSEVSKMIVKFSTRGEDEWVGISQRDAGTYSPGNPNWAAVTKLLRELARTGGVYEVDKKKEPDLFKAYPAPFGNATGVWCFIDKPKMFIASVQARLNEDCSDNIAKYEYEIVRDRYAKPETFDTLEDCIAQLEKLPSTSSDPRDEQIEQLKAEVAKLQKQLATATEKN